MWSVKSHFLEFNVHCMEDVVLLTNRNKFMEKIKAHKLGLKHYAFSIIIFNIENEMLLQQRALTKYHSGGLWSNACCGHPLSVDSISHIKHQAIQRLFEELGFTTDIHYQCTCEYKFMCSGLIENEVDYVFTGLYTGDDIQPDKNEVNSYKWTSLEELKKDILNNPDRYTSWFKFIVNNYPLMQEIIHYQF